MAEKKKTDNPEVEVDKGLIKSIVTKFTMPIKETFEKLNASTKESRDRFASGLKELSGGVIDLEKFNDNIKDKTKAVGDLFAPITMSFGSIMGLGGDAEDKDKDRDKKKDKKEKTKDKKDDKRNKKKDKLDKKQEKGIKGFLTGLRLLLIPMGLAALKFGLIALVVGTVLFGLYKLADALGVVNVLQGAFNLIQNLFARFANGMDHLVLALNDALGPLGFLSDAEEKAMKEKMAERTTGIALRKQRAEDAKEMEEINQRYNKQIEEAGNDEGKIRELNLAREQEIAERGLITDEMYLNEQGELVQQVRQENEETGRMETVEVVVEGAGGDRFSERVLDESSDVYLDEALENLGKTEEEVTQFKEDREYDDQANFTALAAEFKAVEKDEEIAKQEEKIANLSQDWLESDERFAARQERERAKLTQMESDRDQYRRISSQYVDEEGLSAAERIDLMATTGKDGEAYRSFDYDDLEREFEELNPDADIDRGMSTRILGGVGNDELQRSTGERLQRQMDEGEELDMDEKIYMNYVMPQTNFNTSNSSHTSVGDVGTDNSGSLNSSVAVAT